MKDNQQIEQQMEPSAVAQSLNKFAQGLKDGSKFQRKNALETMKKQISDSLNKNKTDLIYSDESIKYIFKTTLTIISDQIEKCREIAVEIIGLILEKFTNWDNDMTTMTIMCIMQRLGGKEVKETSEEIRLQLFSIIDRLIELKSENNKHLFEIHFQELTSILINSFNDNYPEVKKKGCTCTKLLAKNLAGANFHMQSESFVKPLITNITHQHSRVRKDIIDCMCDVVMYGNNKSVTDVLPHLAQRLFDQAPIVRTSIIKLVGTWLLDLPDRYSFFHKLIPLLLTGFIDENPEIKDLTESLWWDVGMKYEKENDAELKDKSSFLDNLSSSYPSDLQEKRPNLGCRELIRLNASKIVPGILNDTGDWVESTRIKSIQLLYIMIWQAENNITQHLETVLQTIFKSSIENLDIIQNQVALCAKLLGHFTDPMLSLNMAFKTIKKMITINPGAIRILNGLLLGHGSKTNFNLILEALRLLNEISLTIDTQLHVKFLECCETILNVSNYENQPEKNLIEDFEYLMFKTIFTISALGSGHNNIEEKVNLLINRLVSNDSLKLTHMNSFIIELKSNCDSWNDNSLEPIIFSKLIQDCGLSEIIIQHVLSILKASLDPSKDPQIRTRFLLLIPEIFSTAHSRKLNLDKTENNAIYIEKCLEEIINEMILPNIIWKAGRSASAVRMTAIASLALIMQEDTIKNINIKNSTIENLVKMMLSSLDDDNRSTRSYVCKLFFIVLSLYGNKLDKDNLHKLYPEFIKRLDDQSEEIRFEIIKVFQIYVQTLNTNYDKVLYQAHLQFIFENILLYLDDPNLNIQLRIYELLKNASQLDPELMLTEIDKVKEKHRNRHYCEQLITYCKESLSKP